jgi:hypothetical protein
LKSPGGAPRRTNQNRGVSANRAALRILKNGRLTKEQKMNYVLCSFREDIMFRAVVEEAAALTSIALFLGMIAVWAQVISAL